MDDPLGCQWKAFYYSWNLFTVKVMVMVFKNCDNYIDLVDIQNWLVLIKDISLFELKWENKS